MLTFTGSQWLRAPRPTVWQLLTTPERVTPLVPQLQQWSPTAVENQFLADLVWMWGGKTVCFPSQISWYNEVALWQAQMHIKAQTAQSSFTAVTQMQLQPGFAQQTELVWEVTAVFTGTLAEIPAQFTQTAALIIVNKFFRAVRTELSHHAATTTLPNQNDPTHHP